MLHNAHKENKRAKSKRLFAHLIYLIFKLSLGFELDFEFGLGLALELWLEFGLGLGLGKQLS